MTIYQVLSNQEFYVAYDEAAIAAKRSRIQSHELNCAYGAEDSLRCDNVDGVLTIFNERDREICTVSVNLNFDMKFNIQFNHATIHGIDVDLIGISPQLRDEITHEAENYVDMLNETALSNHLNNQENEN